MATIEIKTRDVDNTSVLPNHKTPQHTFLIYTNDNGDKQILRGGQVSDLDGKNNLLDQGNVGSGDLLVVLDSYNKKSIDWEQDHASTISSTIASGSDNIISQIWSSMVNKAQEINNQGYDYEYFTQNCNTTTKSLIEAGTARYNQLQFEAAVNQYFLAIEYWKGLDLPKDNDGNQYWTPGIEQQFEYSIAEKLADFVKNNIFNSEEFGKNTEPSNINNSLLNLEINTNNPQSSSNHNNQTTQTGNVIGDGDWQATMKLDVVNGDGFKNIAMSALVSDYYRPGNQEISNYQSFASQYNQQINNLDKLIYNNSQTAQNFFNSTQLNVNLSNLTNEAIGSRTFLNIDPVVLDLNNDGVKLTSYNNSEVTFDVDNDNKQERTGWVSKEDGILVEDVNQDGKINNITETISEYYNPNDGSITDADGKYSNDGLAALKKLDSNHDNKFNSTDAKWHDLRVWIDANSDAVTDEGELKTLIEAEIKEMVKFVAAMIILLIVLLMPVRSYASMDEEEKLNNYLKDNLKVSDQDLNYHKNKFLEMNRFKYERDKIYQKFSNNFSSYRRGLIDDIAKKYNLNPKNKKDYCDLMERVVFYLAPRIDDLEGSKVQFCSNKGDGCVQIFEYRYDGFDESDTGNEIYVYLISDYAGNPIGIWSSFETSHGIKIESEKYFKISRSPYSDSNSLTIFTKEDFFKQKNNVSYLKVDGCYLEEINVKPKIFVKN